MAVVTESWARSTPLLRAAVDELVGIAQQAEHEQAVALAQIQDLRALATDRAALPRGARQLGEYLRTLPVATQRRVCNAVRADDLVQMRTVIADLDSSSDPWARVVAAELRRLLVAMRANPGSINARVSALLHRCVASGMPMVASFRPVDRPLPRQVQPARGARCPHGPDLPAVDRTRHSAGTVTALRVA